MKGMNFSCFQSGDLLTGPSEAQLKFIGTRRYCFISWEDRWHSLAPVEVIYRGFGDSETCLCHPSVSTVRHVFKRWVRRRGTCATWDRRSRQESETNDHRLRTQLNSIFDPFKVCWEIYYWLETGICFPPMQILWSHHKGIFLFISVFVLFSRNIRETPHKTI